MSGESGFDDQPLPVNLHFPDDRVLTVDVDAIVRSGRRMRRNRTALVGAVAAAAIGVVGVSATHLAPASFTSTPVAGVKPSASARQTPDRLDTVLAGGGHVTVIDSRANAMNNSTVSAVAWPAGLSLCYGAVDEAPSGTLSIATTCAIRPPALSSATVSTAPTVLAPHLVTGVSTATGAQAAIGFVRGDVAKVSLEVSGHRYDATVVPVPGSPAIGAYAVWIGGQEVTASQFTQITGYDSRGAVVAGPHS